MKISLSKNRFINTKKVGISVFQSLINTQTLKRNVLVLNELK